MELEILDKKHAVNMALSFILSDHMRYVTYDDNLSAKNKASIKRIIQALRREIN